MKFTRIPPSDAKVLTDKETGLKLSYRDLTIISSKVTACSSLIKFGEEVYNQYKDTGYMFLNYDCDNGKWYAVYKIKNKTKIKVKAIHSECCNFQEEKVCYEAIIETLFNMSKSLNLPLVVRTDNKDFETFVKDTNQILKEQKTEDKYHWKTE